MKKLTILLAIGLAGCMSKKTDIEMIQDIGFIACFLMGIALPIILAFILKK